MRLFVGLELEERARAAAAAGAARFKQGIAAAGLRVDARWVVPENLHITLWFIGEVDDARAAAIDGALAPAFAQPPFDVDLGGIGAFPPSGVPRVFWIGVENGTALVQALYGEVAERLGRLGFAPERRSYSPHLTIARVKDVPRSEVPILRRLLDAAEPPAGRSRITAVTLFRSRLSPKGSSYEPRLRVPLT